MTSPTPWGDYNAAPDLEHVLFHAHDALDQLKGASVFLTGGTGFIGLWLAASFLRANAELGLRARLTILTRGAAATRKRLPRIHAHPDLTFVTGNTKSFPRVPGRFTHFIHAAADVSPDADAATSDGTRESLDFALQHGVRRFLYLSSGAVYGPQPPQVPRLVEDHSFAPIGTGPRQTYAQTKRQGERWCAEYSMRGDMDITIARGFAFLGPGLPCDSYLAAGNFIRDAIRGGPIRVHGDGRPYRSYLYAADLAAWLWTIAIRGRNGRAYNVGSESRLSVAELAEQVRRVLNPAAEVMIAAHGDAGVPAAQYVPDTTRAREELGLREIINLDHAIRRTADWLRLSS